MRLVLVHANLVCKLPFPKRIAVVLPLSNVATLALLPQIIWACK